MATIAHSAGVGIGTLYRHYPTRADLLAALARRSYRLVLDHARTAADSDEPAPDALERFFEQTIAARDDLILPLHGGPVSLDEATAGLRTEISDLLEHVLARGRRDGTIRSDVTAIDIIITAAMRAHPLPHAGDWDDSRAGKPGSTSRVSPRPPAHRSLAVRPPEPSSKPASSWARRR